MRGSEVTEVLGLRRQPQSWVTVTMWTPRAWPGSSPGPRRRTPHSGNAEGVLSGDMVTLNTMDQRIVQLSRPRQAFLSSWPWTQ